MEELLENCSDATCEEALKQFQDAHASAFTSSGKPDHALSDFLLGKRRVALLGRMQRFRDQGEEMCSLAGKILFSLDKHEEAGVLFREARKIAEANGFFSVEFSACEGLGKLAIKEGRAQEGVELLQNALVAACLCEGEEKGTFYELSALISLTGALVQCAPVPQAMDKVEQLLPRLRELAHAKSGTDERLNSMELESYMYSALLHEARGRPEEAAREVRTMLDLVRENEGAVQDQAVQCKSILLAASLLIKVLDPETGEEELVKAVAVELAKMLGA